jgi:hypothetical protein
MPRFVSDAVLASTSRMWQFGQIAETISMSSMISDAQPRFATGSGLVPPLWLTFLKHPFAVVQGGSPN